MASSLYCCLELKSHFDGADQPGNAAITADYENAGIRHVLAAEAIGDLHARHPYIYASAEDLCIGDVELVLSAYKQMVRLCKDRGNVFDGHFHC